MTHLALFSHIRFLYMFLNKDKYIFSFLSQVIPTIFTKYKVSDYNLNIAYCGILVIQLIIL